MPPILQLTRPIAAGCAAGTLAVAAAFLPLPDDAHRVRASRSAAPAPSPESAVMHLIWERTHCRGCDASRPGEPGLRREHTL